MTTQNNHNDTRDEVLFAFHQACERPTAAQIIEWTHRYPQLADDIRAHAAVARDWEARKDASVAEPDAGMLDRGYSRVLNALYNAAVAATATGSTDTCQSFQQMMAASGTDVPRLARELDIARSVLADLFNGGMLAPVGSRLVNALIRAFGIKRDHFDEALLRALNAPRLGHAKSDGRPTVIPRTYDEVVLTSNMTPERVRHWLSEDE